MEEGLIIMAAMYMIAGMMHFIFSKAYLRIMPLWLPSRKLLVYASGLAEIVSGGLLFFEQTRHLGIYSIVAMLVIFLIVHFNMLRNEKTRAGLPMWALVLRIPLQGLLIWWALFYLH
jgi:uncharacterized membrane protein